jgi:hypothetical protein
MGISLKFRTDCRACGNPKLVEVFSLGKQPLANNFTNRGEAAETYPLEVRFCEVCSNAQLSIVIDPKVLYSTNYPYITSRSETMHQHFGNLWSAICHECQFEPLSVLEVGANDGYFLEWCKQHGAESVLGIDPAQNLQPDHAATGVISICGMFDEATAAMAHTAMPSVSVIVARHVFAHVDDWQSFMKNLDTLANRDTLVCIEVPYLVDTLARCEWDQTYHEHLSYVTIKAMAALLDHSTFRLQKVIRFPVHGGSIVIFIRRKDHPSEPDSSVQSFMFGEHITLDDWRKFSDLAHAKIKRLAGLVKMAYASSKIVGFGASAKSTVWVSACGFTARDINFICDSTPQKQGKFSPGSDIPIVPESELTNAKANMAINFAWNFTECIIAKNQKFIIGGGEFLNPHEV